MITVSIVEDNAQLCATLARVINRAEGFRCLSHYATAEAALEALPKDRPDVVLMDINLPGISGIEALQILREDPATAHIPVIALSANAMPRDIEKGLKAGFFRYLTKPINVDEFMGTLNIALEFAGRTQAIDQFSRDSERQNPGR